MDRFGIFKPRVYVLKEKKKNFSRPSRERLTHVSLRCVAERLRNRLKEYSLVTPFSTDSHGHYLSHLLSATHKQRVKREAFPTAEPNQKLFFNISAFGKEFHLRLRPNSGLVAPGAMVEWHGEADRNVTVTAGDPSKGLNQSQPAAGAERILHRELLKTDCTFIGDITDVPGASVAINNCDGLVSLPPTRSSFPCFIFFCLYKKCHDLINWH